MGCARDIRDEMEFDFLKIDEFCPLKKIVNDVFIQF